MAGLPTWMVLMIVSVLPSMTVAPPHARFLIGAYDLVGFFIDGGKVGEIPDVVIVLDACDDLPGAEIDHFYTTPGAIEHRQVGLWVFALTLTSVKTPKKLAPPDLSRNIVLTTVLVRPSISNRDWVIMPDAASYAKICA